MPPAFFRRPP
ncbi:hypothetical protein PAMC26510_28405 [Caballeronia sordidicola]|uniref:Uncharacterized protein n=1 Tax=Caballeronia sordidicola TaxID=196367 RepID=A0A242MDN7_CABSO|nr:hypothetical protein PAMC26510_28405 [Caballeronia sordidicola]OTP71873.1 hypothetical protein PAMC26577_23210 [Caballeronia sordidicola]